MKRVRRDRISLDQTLYQIHWRDSKYPELFIFLIMGKEEGLFLNVDQIAEGIDLDFIEQEIQSLVELQNYVTFLENSTDVHCYPLGHVQKKETYLGMKDGIHVKKRILNNINFFYALWDVRQHIKDLSIKNEYMLQTYDQNNQLVTQETVDVFYKDGRVAILPLNQVRFDSLEEEKMTLQELLAYLFTLVVEEGFSLRWFSTSNKRKCTEIPNITVTIRQIYEQIN